MSSAPLFAHETSSSSLFVFALLLLQLQLQLQLSQSQNVIIPGYETHWFTQQLAPFEPQNNATFQQRWLVNTTDWDPTATQNNGVIFFYAGNEGPIDVFWNNTGLMFQWAPEFGAIVVAVEHRFYGETLPFGQNFSTANLRHLTMENAVADFANFMTWFKTSKFVNAHGNMDGYIPPVIVFGGSYGGILGALCRIHYPAIFDIVLASSAPIPQVLNAANVTIFFHLVTADYYNVNPKCVDVVRAGFAQLIEFADNGDYDTIVETFNLCPGTPMHSMQNLTYLELWARTALLVMAQVDYPYAADFMGALPAWPVNYTCNNILLSPDFANLSMKALATAAGFYYNASAMNTLTCFNMTEEYIYCADQTGCGTGTDAIAENYQQCTQVINAMNTNNVSDMFPPRIWELGNLTEYCEATFGVTPQVNWMPIWFPLDVADATSQIIFSNGLLDPFHGGGYMHNLSATLPAVVIGPGAHHLDLRGKHVDDPIQVTQARELEKQYILDWLSASA